MLRHTLATMVYRGAKTLRDAPEGFAQFRASEDVRTPVEILAHIGDLMDWGTSMAQGRREWRNSKPLPWPQEVKRFFAAAARFDEAINQQTNADADRLFQGPIADALTHFGQLGMLRRIYGAPVRSENYYRAKIVEGCVGEEQPAPVMEF